VEKKPVAGPLAQIYLQSSILRGEKSRDLGGCDFFVISSAGARCGHPEPNAKDRLGRSEKSEFALSVVEGRSDLSGKAKAGQKKIAPRRSLAPLGMTDKF
jgi:hypothetical protein